MKNQKRIQTRKNLIINKFNLFILLLGISPTFIQAQTYTWTGNQGTAWSNSSNWTGASGTPTAGSSVIIPNTSNDPVIFDDDNFTISELRVQSGGKLTLQNGAILNVTKSTSGATTTCITNDGTIVNRGVINLKENGATTQPAFQNNGVFQNNAETNIDSGELNITDVSGNGIDNAGTFTNFGNSDIGITNVAGVYGINTSGTFTNNGEIIISGGDDLGLRVSGGSSTFINNDLLDITACANGVNLTKGATLNNSGDIYLDDIVNVAIMVNNDNPTDPTFNNNATGIININQRNTVNCNNGIIVFDGFFYNTGGQINIDYTSNPTSILDKAIQLSNGSIFVNEDGGIVNLAPLGSNLGQTAITVFEGGTLLNSACSGIINNSLQSRLSTLSGAFNNNGWIVSYSNAPSNISTNFGTVVNYGNAPVNINDALANPAIKLPTNYTHVWTGAEDDDWTNLCNWASETLPTTTSEVWIERETFNPVIASDLQIQALGISGENSSRINLNSGVTLTLDGASDVGLLVEGEVVNNGTIRINNTAGAGMQISNSFSLSGKTYISETGGVGGAGIITDADASLTISNCAEVHVYENVNLNEPINNQGYLLVNSAETNTGTITNNGVLNFPLGSSNLSITNNDLIINHFDLNGCTVSNILSIGSSNNFLSASTWYSNAAQTDVLGTYNSVDNTFTISTTPSQGTQNVYFNVSGNGCTYNVQIPYTIEIPNNNRITWTGAVDNNWNEACNWNPAIVPTADEEAWIPSQTNSPIIQDGVMANAKYVRIQPSATLTIASGGQLNVTDSDGDGIRNQGTLVCQLNSVLNITDPFGRGFYNDGGTINNQGIITITDPEGRASMQAGGYGLLHEDGTINNNANGSINISMGIPQNDDSGMEIRSGNVFNNANATIMTDAPSGFDINIAGGTLTNEGLIDADGDINVTSIGTLTTIVNSTSSYGEITLNSTGTASLNGTINATVNYVPNVGDRIAFIASASSISDVFATENLPVNWETDYSVSTEVALVLNPTLITWTGTVDNDWTNPSNWSPAAVPTADADVIIPNQTNDPIIQDNVVANTKSVHIEPSAQLTIQNGGRINVTSSDGNGIYNQGTIESQFNGIIFISNTTGVAIYNEGTITTRGNINISEPDGHGLVNDGGTINNNANGTINFSMNNAPADKNALELLSGNIFNNANASIFPNAPNGFDVNIAGGTLTNEGFIAAVGDLNVAAAGTLTTVVNSTSNHGRITLNDNSTAYLDGTVGITLNYTPNDGDRIAFIASANSTSGTFATENLPSFWVTDYSVSTEVALVYVGVYTPGLWDGDAGDGEWNTAANWDGNVLPTTADNVVIDNGDAVTLSSGSVEVESIDLSSTSSLSISSGATLTASGKFTYASSSTASIWIDENASLTNSGDINLTGPNVTRGINCKGTLTNQMGATITFSDTGFDTQLYTDQTSAIEPVVVNSGTMNLIEPDFLGIDVQGGTITNTATGIIDIDGTFGTFCIYHGGGTITNEEGGIIDINGGLRGLDNRDEFNNAGTLIINNTSSRSVYSITDFNNTGNLQGTGTFRFEGYDLDGSIVPGNSPGVMDFEGDQTFTAASTLEIEINGTASAQRDQINVDGTATISGTLAPSINYTPSDGDRIVFLTATAISGTFATVSPTLAVQWTVDYSVAGEVAFVYTDYTPGLWDGDAGDGEWNTAANWDGDILPTANDDVLINNGDAVTLSSGSVEVKSITLFSSSSLNISSGVELDINGGGTLSGFGISTIIYLDNNTSLTNSGNVSMTGPAAVGCYFQGTFTNNAGANLSFSSTGIGDLFSNRGTTINYGTITLPNAAAYALDLTSGTFTNAAGGVIDIDNASFAGIKLNSPLTNAVGGTIYIDGIRGISKNSNFMNAGTLAINTTGSYALDNDSGTFSNTGSLTGTGNFILNGSDLAGTVIPGNDLGTMNFDGDQVFSASNTMKIDINGTTANTQYDVIDVDGTVTISGTLTPSINYTPTFGDRIIFLTANSISGTFTTISPALSVGWSIDYSIAGEVALVYTYIPGLWDGDAGDGEWTTAANWDGDILPTANDDVVIDNGDAVTLSSGSVEVATINLSGNSSLSISSGATLTASGKFNYSNSNTASIWINSGSTITNSGDINLTATNVTRGLNCGGTLTNNTGANITFSDSGFDYQLYTNQTSAIEPIVMNSGTITLNEPDFSGIEIQGGTLTNNSGGLIEVDGTSGYIGIFLGTGTITNANGGIIDLSGGWRGLDNRDEFNNAGTLIINNASSFSAYSVSDFNNTGSIKGTGKWYFEGYDLDGNILPGNDIGAMNFDDSQVFTASSTFEIEVNGTTNALRDRINVNGTATISGTLAPSINYTPTFGDRIVFLTATAISGTFSTIDPALPSNWSVDYSVAGQVALVYDYTPGLWDGDAGDSEWTTATNWDGDILPTTDDDVVINNGDAVTLSSGSVEVGTINLSGNSSLSISSGATLTASGKFNYSNSNTASIWINSGSTITNSGDINLTATNVTRGLNCGGTLTNNAGANITFSDSGFDYQLYTNQTSAIEPIVMNSGTITLNEPDFSGIEIQGGTLTNNSGGLIEVDGTSGYIGIFLGTGTITNASGGIIDLSGGWRGLDNRDEFNNAGTLIINNASSFSAYSVSDFNNTGSIKGTGKWYFEGYELDGNILPGNDIGTMNFDDSQVFTASSTFEIEVNGTTNALRDRINVNGTATISGTLAPSINYTPTDGDRIVFLTATTISGTFATISPALSLGWSVDYSIAGEVALVYCAPVTYYLDSDDDGFGDPAVSIMDCSAPIGYVADNTDCDDNDGNEFPGQTWYEDADNDGYSTGTTQTACERPTGYRPASELVNTTDIDCNDNNTDINPHATEICNGVDDNCDTQIDEGVQTTYYADTDGDGFGDPAVSVMGCSAPTGYVTDNTDCDDTDGNEFPGQTWYIDADGDDYGSYSTTACERPTNGFLLDELMGDGTDDCVDNNAAINPSAKEICDGIDNDCDGLFDSDDPNYVDNTMPTLSCPSNINTTLDAGQCGATVSWTAPTATDNCIGSFTATQTMGEVSGTLFPVDTHTIQYTATDDAGNAATCSFTITVTDTDAPSASCQDVTVQLDTDGNGSLNVAQVDNGSSDVCGIKTMTLNQSTFDCSQVGQQSVTLTVVDNSDNTSSCTANVTVVDGIAPNAQCKDISRNLNANGTKNINANAIDKNSSDACGIANMSLSQTQFFCEDVGSNTVTLTVTDVNGNSSTCTATVIINDNTAPTAVCKDVTVQLDTDGNGSLSASQVDNGSSDACGITSSSIDMSSFSCDEIGNQSVILSVADETGNTSNCTATVTVEDNIAPVAVCQDKTVVFNGENQANVAISELFDASNSYDNCGTVQVIAPSNDEVISCGQIGSTISVTISVSDDYGNTADCISNITVSGLPCGWVDDGGIGCQSDPSTYDASNESYELSTSDCSPAYPYVNDEMAFTYTELCGDGELTVFVSGVLGDGFAGIMMRESTDPDARKVAIATNGINQIMKEVRLSPSYPAWPQAVTAYDQLWLRISRTGFSFKAYASVDGVNWLPYIFQNVQMGDCIQVGMYTYTKVANNNVTATFEEVTLTGGNSNLAEQPSIITFGEAASDIPTPTVDVYPNPAIDFLNIVTGGASTKGSIQIVNASGQNMYQVELLLDETQHSIDVSNWPKGMYILRVEQDGQVINKQVIIQ